MKKLLVGVAILAGIYGISFVFDVFVFKSVTSDSEIALAHEYVTERELPQPPREFYEDGCTAWPDSILWHDFYEACLAHDIAYWAGGELERKLQADLELSEAIAHTGPLGPIIAPIMYVGVAYFGDNFVSKQLGSNWGYGWNE